MEASKFKGWHRSWTPTGPRLAIREAPDAGYIQISPRTTPVLSVRAITDAACADLARQTRAVRAISATRVVTEEGEHGAIVVLTGDRPRGAVFRSLAVVFAEDYQAVVDAAFHESHYAVFAETVESLARGFPLLAGLRRRPFEFTAPDGWAARNRGLLVHFYAPSHAKDGTLLSVLPAEPHGLASFAKALVYEDMLEQFALEGQAPVMEFRSFFGLTGQLHLWSGSRNGRSVHVGAVIADDERYRYVVRQESARRIDPESALLPVARSIHPVPRPECAIGLASPGVHPLYYYSD